MASTERPRVRVFGRRTRRHQAAINNKKKTIKKKISTLVRNIRNMTILRRVSSRQRLSTFDDGLDCLDDDCFFEAFETIDDSTRKRRTATTTAVSLTDVPDDLLLNVFSFCDKASLANVLRITNNRTVKRVLSSEDAKLDIWKPLVMNMFPIFQNNDKPLQLESPPPKHVFTCEPAKTVPTRIDETLFDQHHESSLQLLDTTVVQYTGTTGRGDRCVRSNLPFPPKMVETMGFLRTTTAKPFLMGITNAHGEKCIIPTKRAYYEVTILETTTTPNDNTNDCVAVGLSLQQFRLHGRQPGWDLWSFGLHGDDGGLFHSDGQMIRKYVDTPFQPGDTIGCGIDYETSCIFYTVNGIYKDIAFRLKETQLQLSWYPTVGLDSNHPVKFNFGQEAFQYKEFATTTIV